MILNTKARPLTSGVLAEDVKEWEAFKVPSLFSAAEYRRLAMTIGLSSTVINDVSDVMD